MRRKSSACWTSDALWPGARAPWITAIFGALIAATSLAASAQLSAAPASAPAQHLSSAELIVGYTDIQVPPPAGATHVLVQLPARFGASGPSRGTPVHWIRLSFELAALPSGDYGIYLPYAAPRAAVFVNGTHVGVTEEFDNPHSDSWNYPLYISTPATLLRRGANDLLIELLPQRNGLTELGPIRVGRTATLYARYERRLWLQVTGVEVVTLLVGLIGVFIAVLWARRRSETLFGLFALSCGIWIIRNTQFFVVDTYSPFYFAVVTDAALFWLVAVLFRLSFRLLGRRFPRMEAALFAYALLASIAMLVAGPKHKFIVTAVSYGILMPTAPVFQIYLTWQMFRAPSVVRLLLWVAALVTCSAAAYDFALMLEWVPWPASNLMPYSALFFALTVGWALIDRFVKSHNEYEQLNAALEARVRERERALSVHYARAAELEREQTIIAERERILRDMHDGLGSHLISARRLIEKGGQSGEQIAGLLGDAMDELRIAIDSMKPSAGDLLLMLGNLRYRLEPRLNASGINLHWEVCDTCAVDRLGPTEVTEITRIVQEVCTNAMKHSHATEMWLAVRCPAPQTVQLTITDNGCGYDPAYVRPGEGLKNMRRRARSIGAGLEIASRPGETVVGLRITTSAAGAEAAL